MESLIGSIGNVSSGDSVRAVRGARTGIRNLPCRPLRWAVDRAGVPREPRAAAVGDAQVLVELGKQEASVGHHHFARLETSTDDHPIILFLDDAN